MCHPIRSFLAAAAVALSACDAGAVALNPRGIGEALIYPYYTVNGGQDTLVTINNVSDIGKVAKVFIREGANGRLVMDFIVFLAPHDSWSGAISSSDGSGLARIGTGDHSCLNDWASNPQPFSTVSFDGSMPGSLPSDWRTPDRTREGMIEIINAGDIVPGSPLDLATTPVQNGNPDGGRPSCAGTGDDIGLIPYLQAPTEGLIGTAAIVNVSQGTFYPYNAQALSGFSDHVLFDNTATVWNGLDRANSNDAASGAARAKLVTGSGEPLMLDYARGIDAVSAVFMADHLYNDYLVNPAIGAATDWVVTFPTREFYVDPQSASENSAPFEQRSNPDQSPVAIEFESYDREALTLVSHCPPGLPECFTTLPYQVNVVPVTDMIDAALTSILSTRLSNEQTLPPVSGSGHIDLLLDPANTHVLAGGTASDGTTVYLHGLPVTGFMVYNVINTNAQPGRLANYGGLFPHRTTLSCEVWGSDYVTFCF